MKVNLRFLDENLSREETKKKIVEMGIKEENISMIDCSLCGECTISNRKEGELDICFSWARASFWEKLKECCMMFSDCKTIDSIMTCSKIKKKIYVDLRLCYSINAPIFTFLPHEILHLKEEIHCDNPQCLFYKSLNAEITHSFCDKHKKIFEEVIKEINGKES